MSSNVRDLITVLPDATTQAQAFSPSDNELINSILRAMFLRYGTIDADFDGNGLPKVLWDGSPAVSEVGYPYNKGFAFQAGDYVAAIRTNVGSGYLIICAIGNSAATGLESGSHMGYAATSESSVTIGTGTKTFSILGGTEYAQGVRVRAFSRISGNYIEGVCTSFDGVVLVMTADVAVGSGAHTDWNLSVAGEVGAAGADGVDGVDGINGVDGVDGVDGVNGVDGVDGAPGINAPQWFSGSANPSTSPPGAGEVAGDFYLRTNGSKSIFQYDGVNWNNIGF